jgi:hypothetical protein
MRKLITVSRTDFIDQGCARCGSWERSVPGLVVVKKGNRGGRGERRESKDISRAPAAGSDWRPRGGGGSGLTFAFEDRKGLTTDYTEFTDKGRA